MPLDWSVSADGCEVLPDGNEDSRMLASSPAGKIGASERNSGMKYITSASWKPK